MKFNLLYFIRLFSRHIYLILGVPLFIALSVFLFTKNEPRTYISKATVYTSLASGSSIDLSTLQLNTVNTAFDNLMGVIRSRETIEEVGLRLFASHLVLDKVDTTIIQSVHFQELMQSIPQDVKQLKVPGDFDKTYTKLDEYKKKTKSNYLTEVLLKNRYYGVNPILEKLSVRRLQSSDNIELAYECDDPSICQNTLLFLIDAFKKNYMLQKAGASNDAVVYYEAEVAKAAEKLKISEDELLNFNQENQIINYSEQSKYIAARKEAFESGYQDVLKQNAAANAVIELLEKKMSPMEKQKVAGSRILNLRQQLAQVNQQLAMESLTHAPNDEQTPADQAKFHSLTQKAYGLKQQMRTTVDSLYNLTNSMEGIPSNSILTDWLNNIIDYEGTNAQITTLNQLRKDFDVIYSRFAPMGATMRRLERKVSVNEDEYITLLKNLGLANLRQQGLAASSGFSVIDAPYYPTIPQANKRNIMVLAAWAVGLFFILFIILVLDLFDPSLRNATKAKSSIKLSIDGIYPIILAGKKRTVDIDIIQQNSTEAICRKILLNLHFLANNDNPKIITFFSTRNQEGKSFLAQQVVEQFNKIGERALWLQPKNKSDNSTLNNCIYYEVSNNFLKIESLDYLKFDEGISPRWSDYTIILLELPGVISFSYPINLMKSAACNYLICRANRSWAQVDSKILEEIKLFLDNNSKLSTILTGVALEEMEDVLGEIPKKRSRIRRIIKSLLSHQSRTKSIT